MDDPDRMSEVTSPVARRDRGNAGATGPSGAHDDLGDRAESGEVARANEER